MFKLTNDHEKRPFENIMGKEQSHTFFSLVQSFEEKKKKKNVTQNIKCVCLCVDNIFFPKFDIIRDN